MDVPREGAAKKRLIKRIVVGIFVLAAAGGVTFWLGKLQPAFDGVEGEATYREKVDTAVEWGKIYLNPLKSEKYSGGREQVRGFLLQDLVLAAKIAGDIM